MYTFEFHSGSIQCAITIGSDLLSQPHLINAVVQHQAVLVTDDRVESYYAEPVKAALGKKLVGQCILPEGDTAKTQASLDKIFACLVRYQQARDTTLIALGGGMITDLTGFAAACYMRGVRYVNLPTTLLAQVDAAIGGKTAINHPQGKNLIGAFHHPSSVLMDVTTLQTLEQRQYCAGLAEVVKLAVIADQEFFVWLQDHQHAILARDLNILQQLVRRSVTLKTRIVSADPNETLGQRQLLNFGHTLGHALEALGGYEQLLHGEAVAIGMCWAMQQSQQLSGFSALETQQVVALLEAFQCPVMIPEWATIKQCLPFILLDKKKLHDKTALVLLKRIGQAIVSPCVIEEIVHV